MATKFHVKRNDQVVVIAGSHKGKTGKVLEILAAKSRARIEGVAGGGAVRAEVDGQGEIVRIKLDKQCVDPTQVAMLEDLVAAAVRDAQRRSEKVRKERLSKVTGGLNLPGLY